MAAICIFYGNVFFTLPYFYYFCKGFRIIMPVQRQNSNNNRNQDQWQLIQLH